GTILLTALLVVLRLSVSAGRQARAERRRARRLDVTRADEVAGRAVAEERARLSRDIERYVRESMLRVATRARGAAELPDPRPVLRTIQADAAGTNVELRRQLGLLRDRSPAATAEPQAAGTETAALPRADLLTAAVVAAIAVVELSLYPRVAPVPTASPTAIVLTLGSCLTLMGRRTRPVAAALACAGLMVLGLLVGAPVQDGFAFLAVTAGLSWELARIGRREGWLALAALVLAALGSRPPTQPGNLVINAIVVAVAAGGGALLGHHQRARLTAEAQATRREQDLDRTRMAALAAHRRAMARELHDSVSHAVGVIAVQAGAAELCFEHDPTSARRSIQIIQDTAEQAVSELDRLGAGTAPAGYGPTELLALVQRMRAAGLPVTMTRSGDPPSEAMPTVYRVVQECLTNALRHAPDARVLVEVRTEAGRTVIRVADDGPGAAESPTGYGLVGLRERVAQLGGSIRLPGTSATAGFEVVVTLPSRVEARS
ncbi:MAG TPA: histidine kinase, partial [Microlunatus sp.]|nr:histidine kinase [Microlunatus sp.]